MDVSVIGGTGSATLRWSPHPAKHRITITGYRVYDFDPLTKIMNNPRDVSDSTFLYTVLGLENGTEYHFVVTAESAQGESSYAYSVSVTP